MLQRIQTLYLLAALGLTSSHLYAKMVSMGNESVKYSQNTKFFILSLIASVLIFITIFLYRKRMVQIRFSVFNIVILSAYQLWLAYLYFTAPKGSVFSFTIIFPLVAAILLLLAVRSIAADEALVRSVSRIRSASKKK